MKTSIVLVIALAACVAAQFDAHFGDQKMPEVLTFQEKPVKPTPHPYANPGMDDKLWGVLSTELIKGNGTTNLANVPQLCDSYPEHKILKNLPICKHRAKIAAANKAIETGKNVIIRSGKISLVTPLPELKSAPKPRPATIAVKAPASVKPKGRTLPPWIQKIREEEERLEALGPRPSILDEKKSPTKPAPTMRPRPTPPPPNELLVKYCRKYPFAPRCNMAIIMYDSGMGGGMVYKFQDWLDQLHKHGKNQGTGKPSGVPDNVLYYGNKMICCIRSYGTAQINPGMYIRRCMEPLMAEYKRNDYIK